MHSLTMVKTLLLVVFFVATITEVRSVLSERSFFHTVFQGKKFGKAVGGVLTAAGSVGLPLAGILGGTGTTSSTLPSPSQQDAYRPDPYRDYPDRHSSPSYRNGDYPNYRHDEPSHRQGYARNNAGMGAFMEPAMALVVALIYLIK